MRCYVRLLVISLARLRASEVRVVLGLTKVEGARIRDRSTLQTAILSDEEALFCDIVVEEEVVA